MSVEISFAVSRVLTVTGFYVPPSLPTPDGSRYISAHAPAHLVEDTVRKPVETLTDRVSVLQVVLAGHGNCASGSAALIGAV